MMRKWGVLAAAALVGAGVLVGWTMGRDLPRNVDGVYFTAEGMPIAEVEIINDWVYTFQYAPGRTAVTVRGFRLGHPSQPEQAFTLCPPSMAVEFTQ